VTKQRIETIPIAQIRVVNSRARNRKTFRGIVSNIGTVGLKKPLTVFQRPMASDGTQYDLVCGEGRMEALAALGSTDAPALITTAPLKDRFLMSLVENIARKRPPQSDLLREVRSLQERGYTNAGIAEKLGMGHTYVEGIVQLLRRGEDRLVEQVEAGTVPLSVAIQIATAASDEVQRALSEAYDRGDLRGAKLRAVQHLIARRSTKKRTSPNAVGLNRKATSGDLAKEYELHTQRQRALVKRATVVHERLVLVSEALKRLLADTRFVALLRAEALDTMPAALESRLV
jgi:ParB family chromosome partitioning protein